MNREEFWRGYFYRSPEINPFPRQFLRKRMQVESLGEISSLISTYENKTDIYTSLYSDWQMQNNVYDCIFFEIDCYWEAGETLEDLNEIIGVVDNFLFEQGIWYRSFFSGKKGKHYYIAIPPTHFFYFSEAVRSWASTMPKVERVDMQRYWSTGEIEKKETWPFDPRAIGRSKQLVRIPYTKHPLTGLYCSEVYGKIVLPMQQRHERWLPEMNEPFLERLKSRDRKPEMVDRTGGVIDFDFSDSPRCIRNALRLMSGHLSHDQAWHFTNYMLTLGATDEEILNCFRIDHRFNECLARVQIDSIRKGGLANMSCEKISFIGLCDERQRLSCPMWPSIDRYLFCENGNKDKV